MSDILTQIKNDIAKLQEEYILYDNHLSDSQYSFTYWILNHLFNIDVEDTVNYIVEKSGNGIDCFVHYEDTKELYIIQNKFYPHSVLKSNDVAHFLSIISSKLKNDEYKYSVDLQDIFNNAKNDEQYNIYVQMYVADSRTYGNIRDLFDGFSLDVEASASAQLLTLQDINELYYGDRHTVKKNFEYDVHYKTKKSILSLNPNEQNMEVSSNYIALQLSEIFNMNKEAQENGYFLFDENVRDFLGLKGKGARVNRDIAKTLRDENKRQNFFLYNNGITIICDKMEYKPRGRKNYLCVKNPKIVNGCQTTNTIFTVINELSKKSDLNSVLSEFSNIFVLTKFYQLDRNKAENRELYNDIVKFSNNQTPIKIDDFIAQEKRFLNIQTEFESKGFLLLVKKSDSHKFIEKYGEVNTDLFKKSEKIRACIGMEVKNTKDLFIPYEKLFKMLLAFVKGGYEAFKNGSKTLKKNSDLYKNFSCKIENWFTIESMLYIHLLAFKADGYTSGRKDKEFVPYYFIDFIGRNIKKTDNENIKADIDKKLSFIFKTPENFDDIFRHFKIITKDYTRVIMDKHKMDYQTMTKKCDIDETEFGRIVSSALRYSNSKILEEHLAQ